MDAISAEQAIAILETHAIVPRDERLREDLFAAFAWLHINALGGNASGVPNCG
ncbi:hypothetical protein [Streptomyces sp. BH104]|uniref:hypothetical protein n=1 Tax=Streptomyces sp. BH104 TaxID=3410407 RepID=UPI003BB73AEC